MVSSVGNSIRNIVSNGIETSYFLLGDDNFLQKIFVQNIKNCLNNKKAYGEVINIASGKPISIKEVVLMVKEIVGKGK